MPTLNSGRTTLSSSSSSSATKDPCKGNKIASLGRNPWWITSTKCARKVTEERGNADGCRKNEYGSRTAWCDGTRFATRYVRKAVSQMFSEPITRSIYEGAISRERAYRIALCTISRSKLCGGKEATVSNVFHLLLIGQPFIMTNEQQL